MRAARRPSRRRPAAIPTPTVQWEVSTSGGTTLQRHHRSHLDHLQLHGRQRGKRQPVRGRLHQRHRHGGDQHGRPRLTVRLRSGRDREPAEPDGRLRAAQRPSRRPASGNPAPTVQWEVSTSGGDDLQRHHRARPRPPTASRPPAPKTATSTRRSSPTASAASRAVPPRLTVATAPAVTTSPTSQTVNAGSTATFTAAASGSPAPTVQWEVSTSGGDGLQHHLRRDLDHLQLHGQQHGKRQRVRGRLHQPAGTATSNPATLTVDYRDDRARQPDGQRGHHGDLHGGGQRQPDAPQVQWEVSTDGGTTFTRRLRRDLDHLQLHGRQHAKRQRVRGRLHQQRRHVTSTPPLDRGLRAGRDHAARPARQSTRAARRTFTAAASGNPAPTRAVGSEHQRRHGVQRHLRSNLDHLQLHGNDAPTTATEYEAVFTNAAGTATSTPATLTRGRRP